MLTWISEKISFRCTDDDQDCAQRHLQGDFFLTPDMIHLLHRKTDRVIELKPYRHQSALVLDEYELALS